jgi:flagellar basal-body rod modification protein FlgD
LKLLIAQLKNQDPMKPMDDTQFVTQLAQFSALESMQSLQQEMGSVHQDQDFMKATLLIGKQVKATGADGTDLAGAVSEVHLVGGKVQVVIDGKTTDLSQVTSVTSATTSA